MRIAVITMVFNEPVFLPIWLNHYGPELGHENLFVIDDGSTDDTVRDRRITNLVRRNRSPLDEDDRARLVSCLHEELLRLYDLVIYTDVDELITLDPRSGASLAAYLATCDFDYKNVVGLNVLHRGSSEGRIDLDAPLFEQRRFVAFELGYCKPLISRIPLEWRPGFHLCQYPPLYDSNLFLFHLRAMDVGIATQRIETRNTIVFTQNSLAKGHGIHFRSPAADYLTQFFSTSETEFESAPTDLESIGATLGEGKSIDGTVFRVPERFLRSIRLNSVDPDNCSSLPWSPDRISLPGSDARGNNIHGMFDRSLDRMISMNPDRGDDEPCPCGSGKPFADCHGSSA